MQVLVALVDIDLRSGRQVAIDRLQPPRHRVVDDDEVACGRHGQVQVDAHQFALLYLDRARQQLPLAVALDTVLALDLHAGIDRISF